MTPELNFNCIFILVFIYWSITFIVIIVIVITISIILKMQPIHGDFQDMHSIGPADHTGPYFSSDRKAAGSTSGSSISVEVVAIPPLNIASNTALPTARTNLTMRAESSNKHRSLFVPLAAAVMNVHMEGKAPNLPVCRYPLNPHSLAN